MSAPTLIGDGVENPGNAAALRDAAALFGWACAFHDRRGLSAAWLDAPQADPGGAGTLLALENALDAEDVFGFPAPPASRLALVVGNERLGLDPEVLRLAHRTLRIPLASRRLNTLNVAAAAAVALACLTRPSGRARVRAEPERHRPAVLFLGPSDPVELGAALRSAGAFGWSRVLVEDRRGVWFGGDRATRSLGRGAARRGRNEVQVVPSPPRRALPFDEAVVVTARGEGEPLHAVDLARGPAQVVVVPDEEGLDPAAEPLARLARRVRVASLGLGPGRPRLRLVGSVVLAEVARQVGVRRAGPGRRPPRRPSWEHALVLG